MANESIDRAQASADWPWLCIEGCEESNAAALEDAHLPGLERQGVADERLSRVEIAGAEEVNYDAFVAVAEAVAPQEAAPILRVIWLELIAQSLDAVNRLVLSMSRFAHEIQLEKDYSVSTLDFLGKNLDLILSDTWGAIRWPLQRLALMPSQCRSDVHQTLSALLRRIRDHSAAFRRSIATAQQSPPGLDKLAAVREVLDHARHSAEEFRSQLAQIRDTLAALQTSLGKDDK
jgi:hypothetical protein